jgi:predicted permease
MLDELRAAVRSVLRARGLTATLLVSLSIGIGANAAVSGVAWKLLVAAPPGVEGPSTLRSIYTSEFSGAPYGRTSPPDFADIQRLPSISSAAAIDDGRTDNASLVPVDSETAGGTIIRVRIAAVTEAFFPTLGTEPHAGHLPGDTPGRTAVVSHSLARLLDDPSTIVGRTLALGAETYVVVGVTPERFRGLRAGRATDVWIPLTSTTAPDRGDRRLSIIARHIGTAGDLEGQLSALGDELAARHPDTNRGTILDPAAARAFTAVRYSPIDPEAKAEATLIAAVVIGAVMLLLASACINGGSLLLSRAMARRQEFAVKVALGAGRARLVRQLVAESLLISLGAGALGLLIAVWLLDLLPARFPPEHAELLDTRLDPLLVALTLGVAALAGTLFAVAPAVQETGAPATLALRGDAGGISEQHGGIRVRGILITSQLALSTLLLIGSGLLMSGLSRALESGPGATTDGVIMIAAENPGGSCGIHDPVRGVRFHHAVAEAVPRMPDVVSLGWTVTPPLGRSRIRDYAIETRPGVMDRLDLNVNIVSPGYFATMKMAVIEGRAFDARDGALAEPVAVIDDLLARRHFGLSAVGRHLATGSGDRIRVIGVVQSARYRTLQEAPEPTVYLPSAQEHVPCGTFIARVTGPPETAMRSIPRRLESIDPGVTITRVTTLGEHLSEALAVDRLATTLVGLCGLAALVMSVIGVYGVMTEAVLRRTREIGLRVALGANRFGVVRLVGAEAVRLTGVGVLIGLGLVLLLDRVAASAVHGLPSVDARMLAMAPALLASAIACAALVPLRRALRVNPTIALRAD